MKQQVLKALLEEAANDNCSPQRRNEIQCELDEATAAMGEEGVYKITGREAGLSLVLDALYVHTIQNRPELLPSFFPTFAIICGDRDEGMLIADVDWSLID
jgi:hypothetical protein